MALSPSNGRGQTPLDADEAAQLIPAHISSQEDLNEWEQLNIARALNWAMHPRRKPVLSEAFCRDLHRRMFDQTWRWAGTFRQSDKNIGCDWQQVPMRLSRLFGNAQYWLDEQVFALDESAARFHHALVLIHPFSNGNRRHARLMTDCLLLQNDARAFTWGRADLMTAGKTRDNYLLSLRAADAGDFAPLLRFVRS